MKRLIVGIVAGLLIVAAAIAGDNFNVLDKLNISFSTATITGQLAPANGGSGVANTKNLTWSNSLTLAGTDATTMTFPSTSATLARTDASQTLAGTQTLSSSGNALNVQNAGVAETYSRWRNGTGDAFFGLESSAGGQLISGSAAYSTVITSNNAAPVYLGYGGAIKAQTSATGMAITGTLTTTTAQVITGSSTNDSGAAGTVGELLTGTLAVGSQITLTTATSANVVTLSVTAGDWDCSGQVTHNAAGTTNVTLLQIGISATSATLPTQAGGSGIGTDPLAIFRQAAAVPAGALTTNVGPVRVSLASTTNIFLVANDTFTAAGMQAYGTLRCRRMR